MEELTDLQLAVKSAFKVLVTHCDGPTNAAKVCGGQASHVSEAASPNWPRMPRADWVRAIERHLGKPIFTREMALALGFDLVARDTVKSPETVTQAALDLLKQICRFQVVKAEAEADGRIDDNERRLIIDALKRLISEAHDLIVALDEGGR